VFPSLPSSANNFVFKSVTASQIASLPSPPSVNTLFCNSPSQSTHLKSSKCYRQHQLPTTALSIDGVQVSPVTSARNLGIFIDSDLVMRSHFQRTVSGCFAALRQLRQIRKPVRTATFQSLVVALVLSRLDDRNSVLIGLPIHLLRRLHSVQNAAARLICRLRRFDHFIYLTIQVTCKR